MSTIPAFALIRAAMAHGEHDERTGGEIRRELAVPVRRVHGEAAGRDEAADVNTNNELKRRESS